VIQIEDKILSIDIFKKHFLCDLNACKGACCVEGDSGAPVTKEEKKILKKIFNKVKPYMRKEGIDSIKRNGITVVDSEGDTTTSLVQNNECSFVVFENGITKCSIERAYNEGKINFRKPISCHLFPIRTKKYSNFEAVNYEEIKICKPACECGSKLKIPLYVFLKDSLIRKYGNKWYSKLLIAANKILQKNF
tara:strand:+ start:76837 stop:77412 length:576 start_codon:yes stop_codon:yes gene_type:complete